MPRQLPEKPSLRYLQEQAKDLAKSHRRGDVAACSVLRCHHRFTHASDRDILTAHVSLQEVQHALALDYGFTSWSRLRTHVRQLGAAEGDRLAPARARKSLEEKGNKAAEEVAGLAVDRYEVLEEVLRTVTSPAKKVKNAAAKALKLVSEMDPPRLYPRFEFFVGLVDGEDTILRWIATDVIGNLAGADVEDRIDDGMVAKLSDLIPDESMITAAHAIEALGKIAAHKPERRDEITATLLDVDSFERNPECRNILVGKTILALAGYRDLIQDREAVSAFARRHLRNDRNATTKKAADLLKKLEGTA